MEEPSGLLCKIQTWLSDFTHFYESLMWVGKRDSQRLRFVTLLKCVHVCMHAHAHTHTHTHSTKRERKQYREWTGVISFMVDEEESEENSYRRDSLRERKQSHTAMVTFQVSVLVAGGTWGIFLWRKTVETFSLSCCHQQKGGFFLEPSKASGTLLILPLSSRLFFFIKAFFHVSWGFLYLFKASSHPFLPETESFV